MLFNKTFDQIFTFNNLYKAYKHCLKGCRWKGKNQFFIQKDIINLTVLHNDLINGNYKLDKFNEFRICERGKMRNISAHSFKDRIVQKCLCDYYLVPLLSKSLIYDCGATIKGRGVSFQKKRVTAHLNKYKLNHGNKGFILTIDIHHYFESIDHKILLKLLKNRILDDKIYWLLEMIINSTEKGLTLGSQISQICALYYINEIDHYIKEKLHIKYYGRYMDDLYLIHNDKKYLYKCFDIIVEKLHELKLLINQSKSKVHSLENGFIFLKVKYKLKNDKIIKLITTKTFQSMKRKIKKGINIDTILPSWLDYISHFNCYNKYKKFRNKYLKKKKSKPKIEINYENAWPIDNLQD